MRRVEKWDESVGGVYDVRCGLASAKNVIIIVNS